MDSNLYTRRIQVRGTVQGVGFRPFVYVIAVSEGLKGTVLNDGEGVEIILQGTKEQQEVFDRRFKKELPPLASVDSLDEAVVEYPVFSSFRIIESRSSAVKTTIPADAAVCKDCLAELVDPSNRRYRYPFINCTHCGPRYTITAHIPYDRPQTSMKDFPMCSLCHEEYTDPLDRRFHAQPNACWNCGPQLALKDKDGNLIETDDPIAETFKLIKKGAIGAIKGLGGFHLVCDALNSQTVRELRKRKNRPSKPFAIMTANAKSAKRFLVIDQEAKNLLESSAAPIVLCPKKDRTDELLDGIAPDLSTIGLMLPYTPIHWLLFFEAVNRQPHYPLASEEVPLYLVMTSANAGGEPLVINNKEAEEQLQGIADFYLEHNRNILIRCDDSVIRSDLSEPTKIIRRARGYVPKVTKLPRKVPSCIATGSWLKNTACVSKEDSAILSQHIGDLDRVSNCTTLSEAIEHLIETFDIHPSIIACDFHPDFFSTRLAEDLADKYGAKLFPVQHHHAHIASVMAQHGLEEPVLGVALDGVGLGTDGTSWGGEILLVDPSGFLRLSHFKPVALPGGDKCAKEGWRIAAAFLAKHGNRNLARELFPNRNVQMIFHLIDSNFPIPQSSSLGRLFDMAAALLRVKDFSTYEGEAPVLLEYAAKNKNGRFLREMVKRENGILNLDEFLLHLAQRQDTAEAAADFHTTIASAIAEELIEQSTKAGITKICFSGGCCLNNLMIRQIKNALKHQKLKIYESTEVPCNDGGLSLGQLWVAGMANVIEKE